MIASLCSRRCELYDVTLKVIVSFKSYMMNFVDFVLNCYSHITSHASQVFTSFTHYTSYSWLNIVHVIVCVFGLTNQVCKYFEFFMQKQIWCLRIYEECLKIWILGKLGLKLVFLKNFASHTHAFYSYFSMFGGIYAKTWLFFLKLCFFWIFDWSRLFFDQFKLIQNFLVSLCLFRSIETDFWSIENRESSFLKTKFDLFKLTFQKFFKLFFLSSTRQRLFLKFLSFSTDLFARFSFLQADKSILPFLLHLFSCFNAFFFMHFVGIFESILLGIFVDSSHIFWNWSLDFVPIML